MNYYTLGQGQAFVKLGITGGFFTGAINKFRGAKGLEPAALGEYAKRYDAARKGTEGIATVAKSQARMGLLHEANAARAGEVHALQKASPNLSKSRGPYEPAVNQAYVDATGLDRKYNRVLNNHNYYIRGGGPDLPPGVPPGLGYGVTPGVNPKGEINQAVEAARRKIYPPQPPVRADIQRHVLDAYSRDAMGTLAEGPGSIRMQTIDPKQIALRNL